MKTIKLKKSTKIGVLFFVITLLFSSCQNEDNSNDTEINQNFKVTVISQEQIEENNALKNKLINLKNSKNTLKDNNDVYNPEYDFTVLTDKVSYTENIEGTFHSYSFPIKRENPTTTNLENLVLFLNAAGTYSSMLIEYGFSEEEYLNIDQQNIENTTSTYALIDFDETTLNISKRKPYACVESWEYIVEVIEHEGQLHGSCDCNPNGGTWVLIDMECEWFVRDNTYGDLGNYTHSGYQNGYSSGTTNGGTGTVGVASSPTVPLTMAEQLSNFINLTEEQEFWANKQGQEFITGITDFLLSNCGLDSNPDTCLQAEEFIIFKIELSILLGVDDFIFDDSLTDEETLDLNSITELEIFINEFENSFTDTEFDLTNNQDGTKTTKFKGKFTNSMILPVYLNIHTTSELDNPNTVFENEFNLEEVVSFETGITPAVEWEQDSYEYSSNGNITTVTINGHFIFGVKIEGINIGYTESWIVIISFNNQTGQAISMSVIKEE